MNKFNPVVHFEFPGEDMERMKKFYEEAFNWKLNQMGPEMGNYIVAHTGETDEKGMVKMPGTINGGFYKKTKPDQSVTVVISVADIKEAREKVEAAGGKFIGGQGAEYDDIPGVGLFFAFEDSEGNRVGALQPKMPQ